MSATNPVLARLADERDRVHEQVDQVLAAVEAEERDPSEAETRPADPPEGAPG